MSLCEAKVCAVGDFTSKLAASYLDHIAGIEWEDTGQQHHHTCVKLQLKKALDSANLPVTTNIVVNLLRSIEEHRKEKGDEHEHQIPVSWGEFCACCIALQSHQHQQPTQSGSSNVFPLKPKQRPKFRSNSGSTHQVFLGGSCNPTTWRQDLAVPTLQKAAITYFNPQVDEWFPELIEVEEQAKMTASLLLFVVDNQTRAISSMVEIAYLAGQKEEVVAVVEDICADGTIAGEALSTREIQDLNRGRLFIRNLVEEGGCLLSDSISSALTAAVQTITGKFNVGTYCESLAMKKLQQIPCSLGEELHLFYRVFIMYGNDKKMKLTLSEAELALRSLHIEGPDLQQLLVKQHQKLEPTTPAVAVQQDLLQQYKSQGLTFDEFCCVYAELKYNILLNSGSLLTNYITTPLKWITSWFWNIPINSTTHSAPFVDVFLNGSCGSTTWRSDISIPILKQHGVSYFNPQVENWDRRLLPIEREAKERCSVLLYVVSGETLSVASMVEAAYYIGKGRSVVLCVSNIPSQGETTLIEGMELSPQAVKDYNRGRAYLVSMANKNRVTVYDSVAAATRTAIHLALCLRGQKVQSQHHSTLTTSYSTSV